MLRHFIKNVTLNKLKTDKCFSGALSLCRYSIDKANPQENVNEASSRVYVEPENLPKREESERLSKFRNKLKEDLAAMEMSRYNLMVPKENDPLPPWPNNVNPHTGEIGGPRGPEPTRYGDWERKGICVDF